MEGGIQGRPGIPGEEEVPAGGRRRPVPGKKGGRKHLYLEGRLPKYREEKRKYQEGKREDRRKRRKHWYMGWRIEVPGGRRYPEKKRKYRRKRRKKHQEE